MLISKWLSRAAALGSVRNVANGVLALLGVTVALTAMDPAYAGAGWGGSSNPAPDPSVSTTDPTGGVLVKTYYASSPMGMQVDLPTGALTRYTGQALRKFVDGLPGLGSANASLSPNAGSITNGTYIPLAVADYTTYPGSAYYEIAVVEYTQRLHSDLAKATLLRGYVQIDPKATDDAASATVSGLVGGAVQPAGSAALPLSNPDGSPIMIARPKTDGTFVLVQAYAVDKPSYLGPTIVAAKGTPTRVKFYNALPAGRGAMVNGNFQRNGDLFIPTDHTVFGGGEGTTQIGYKDLLCGDAVSGPNNGPDATFSSCAGGFNAVDGTTTPVGYVHVPEFQIYTENRADLHLHGGDNPWISDGTPHQWITPFADETNPAVSANYQRGVGAINVPDMPNPGPGAMTYMWPNGQSGRMMFYHDHTTGLTRLNVYAGEAAGYLLTDTTERAFNAFVAHEIPLVIQDKTFVPDDIATEDSKWDTVHWGQPGDLWFSHVYETNQDPFSADGTNPVGRWDGASFFWPVFPQAYATPSGAYGDVTITPESFMDTPLVNGIAYPSLTVDPTVYRFRILNAANDRMFNLSLFVADGTQTSASGIANTEVAMVPFISPNTQTTVTYACPDGVTVGQRPGDVNANGTVQQANWTESGLNNAGHILFNTSFPCAGGLLGTGWGQSDARPGGVPDPATMGPSIIRIGNEGGLLPGPVVIDPSPINYEYNKRSVTVLNVLERSLWLGTAERADVIIDFSNYSGKTLILYNDSSAPVPAGDPRIDYYTGDGDQTGAGGAPSTAPGYGPNTRTVMQFVVNSTITGATPANGPTLDLAALTTAVMDGYVATKEAPIVATVDYAGIQPTFAAAGKNFTANAPYEHIYTGAIYQSKFNSLDFTATDTFNYTPAPVCKTSAACLALLTAQRKGLNGGVVQATPGQALHAYVEPKAIQELFDLDFGRMNATLGVELPFTNVNTQTTLPMAYVDPVTETIKPGEVQFWKITHNGVDSHPVHFHLLNVQVINRVGWDGTIKAVAPDELGWKEVVKMHPLEDIIVAVRAKTIPPVPFGLPHSYRSPAPNELPSDNRGITQIDPTTGIAPTTPYTNAPADYGYEYVWHCHILGHEENDFMRPFVFRVNEVVSPAPSNAAASVSSNGIAVTWTDATPPAATEYDALAGTGFLGNPNNEIGFRVERALYASDTTSALGAYAAVDAAHTLHTINAITHAVNAPANSQSYIDSSVAGTNTVSLATPAVPALAGGASSVTLTLPALPAGAVTFTVQRSDSGGAYAPVATLLTGGTWTDSNIVAGHTYDYEIQAVGPQNGAAPWYSYRVIAVNAAGDSAASAPVAVQGGAIISSPFTTPASFVAIPAAGATPVVSAITSSGLTLNWAASAAISQVTGYTVRQATDAGFTQNVVSTPVTGTSLNVTGLAGNKTYYFQVSATNATGTGAYGSSASGLTLPVAVTGLAQTSATTTTVNLSWTAPAGGAAGYTVTGGGTAVVTGTTAAISGLTANTTYTFVVSATNATGTGASANVTGTTVPTAVTALAASSKTASTVNLAWTAPAGNATITGYTVTGGGTAVVSGTTAAISGLTANTAYTFSVTATNAAGTSVAATTAVTTAPATPVVTANGTSQTAGSISWTMTGLTNTAGNVVTYTVAVLDSNNLAVGTISGTGTTRTVTGLTAGSTYTVNVTATSPNGGTGTVGTASFSTAPATPVVTALSNAQTTGSASWTMSGSTAGVTYTVAVVDATSGTAAGTVSVSGTTASVTGLTAGTQYRFNVTATNGTLSSAVGSATFTTAPATPVVSAAASSATAGAISWTMTGSTTGVTYTVAVLDGTNTPVGTVTVNNAARTATVTGLTASTAYTVNVTATSASGSSGVGSATFTTPVAITNAPNIPTGLAASSVTSTSLTLNWAVPATDSTHSAAATYSIQRATNTGFTAGLVTTTGIVPTTLSVTGLTQGTTYYFRVLATNSAGSSAYSATVTQATLTPPAAPAAPTVTVPAASTAASVATVSWTAVANTTYSIYQASRTGAGATWSAYTQVATGLSGGPWVSPALTPGYQYRYYLVATTAGGTSANGATSPTVTAAQLANAPTLVSATRVTAGVTAGVGNRSVTLTWTAGAPNGTTVTGFQPQRVTGATWAGAVTNSTTQAATATSFTVTGLARNTTYTFRVGAVDSSGTSVSGTITVTTAP